jgi:5-methylcytosine-specific restriction endonuclease McrA
LSQVPPKIEPMFEIVDEAIVLAQKAVADFEPDVYEGNAASLLVQRFAHLERIAAAGKALAARRVADSGAWRKSGDRSPAHWMAKTTGTSVGQAIGELETAERLSELPATAQAVRAGQLSEPQAREIASAAAADPESEEKLLSAASRHGLRALKEECARVRAAALPDEVERHERIRRGRRLRHWTDPEGAFRMEARLTPQAGATLLAALEPIKDRIFDRARKDGRRESYDAYAADALVEMAEASLSGGGTSRTSPKAAVHVRIDHAALVRGATTADEVCEIPGVGPIPVATARALAEDAWICTLVTDGTDIKAVSSMKRRIPARLRRAVEERDQTCAVPGCDVRDYLQIDHTIPVHERGPTRLDNLDRLCRWHHYLKTHRGYRLNGPREGPRTWDAPPGGP